MTDELASATVRIDPDLSYFRDKLKAELEGETEGLGQDVNVASDIKVKTSADDASLEETRAEVDAAIPDEKTVHVRTDVDRSGIEEATKATEELEGAVTGLGGAATGAGSGLGSLSSGLSSAGSGAAEASSGVGALLTAILTIGPALIPIGAVLLGTFGALAAIFTAATGGIVAFALAASSQLGPLKDEATALLHQFQQMAAPEVLPVIHDAVALLPPLFAQLFPLVSSVSTEFGHLFQAAQSAMQNPFWESFFGFIQREAGPALDSLASFTGGFVKGFAGMVEAFQPLIGGVEAGLTHLGASFASFGQNLASNQGFQNFLSYVRTEGPVVAQTLDNLWHTVTNLLSGLAPLGAVTLRIVDAFLGFTAAITGFSPILDSVGIGVVGLATAFITLHSVIGLISGPIGSAFTALTSLGGKMTELVSTLGDLRAAFELGAAADTITGALEATEGAAQGAAGVIGGLVGALGGLGPAGAIVGAGIAVAVGAFEVFKTYSTDAFQPAIEDMIRSVTKLPTETLPQLQTALEATKAKQQGFADGSKGVSDAMEVANASGEVYTGTLEKNSDAAAAASDYEQKLQTEIKNHTANVKELAAGTSLTTAEVDKLSSALGINLNATHLTAAEVDKFKNALADQATQAGISEQALTHLAATSGQTTSKIASDVKSATDATTQSWKSFTDLVSTFGSTGLAPTQQNLTNFFSLTELQAAAFTSNIQKAIQEGFDPRLISQIAQAGPAQAGTLLQGLVNTQGGALQQLVKQTEDALTKEGQLAVAQARDTQIAVSATSDKISAELPEALALSQAKLQPNAAAAVATVIETYQGGLTKAQQVANDYGISLPNALVANAAATATAAQGQAQRASAGLTTGQPGMDTAADNLAQSVPKKFLGRQDDAALAGHGQANSAAGGIVAGLPLVDSAALQTANKVPEQVNAHHPHAQAAGTGQAGAVASGIIAGLPGVDSAALTAGAKLPAGVNAQQGASHAAGQGNAGQVGAGFTAGSGSIAFAAIAAMEAAQARANSGVNWASVGASADAGIAQGFFANENVVINAAGSVLLRTQGHATNTLIQARSPSLVWAREVGLPMAQGVAQGLLSGQSTVDSAVAAVVTPGRLSGIVSHAVSSISASVPGIGLNGLAGGGGTVTYSPTYNISGAPDASTVDKWKALMDQHDNDFLSALYARGG